MGWILIALKCIATPWIIAAWQVPVHPAWVIVPTLVLAALVTGLIVAHDWSSD